MKVADCVTENVLLPDRRLDGVWESIVGSDDVKGRLVRQVLLALRLRRDLPYTATGLHGLVLLYGPPGTGKTTLARGVAAELVPMTAGGRIRLVEVDPHGLMSAEHGQSQQHVMELLTEHVPLLADDGIPTLLVLDEVESMAVARSAASLSANPADVHRATDAVLVAMDHLGRTHPHIVTVATSNFTEALDEAFLSRADALIEVAPPGLVAIEAILRHVLTAFATAYPALSALAADPEITTVAACLAGCDGRRVKKIVSEALAGRVATVVEPGQLNVRDLQIVAETFRKQS